MGNGSSYPSEHGCRTDIYTTFPEADEHDSSRSSSDDSDDDNRHPCRKKQEIESDGEAEDSTALTEKGAGEAHRRHDNPRPKGTRKAFLVATQRSGQARRREPPSQPLPLPRPS